MGLLALAIAPGLAICLFIYYRDKYNKEPIWMLLLAFILGILSIIPALAVQLSYNESVESVQQKGTLCGCLFTHANILMIPLMGLFMP